MADAPESEPEPTFEQALIALERIVANLERGEPELASALAKYEKGVWLLSQCHRLLEAAEQSVALLTGVDEEGNPVTATFDATATVTREAGSPPSTGSDLAVSPTAKPRASQTSVMPKNPARKPGDRDPATDVPF